MTGAAFARGASKQDYATPHEFIAAVERRLGKIAFDLAASPHNAQHRRYFGEADDSLKQEWHRLHAGGLLWLNPPYANIAPWVEKCVTESRRGATIAVLVPASVGSAWFRDHVYDRCAITFLSPRLSFDGKHHYPKDCMLLLYGPRIAPRITCWQWRDGSLRHAD